MDSEPSSKRLCGSSSPSQPFESEDLEWCMKMMEFELRATMGSAHGWSTYLVHNMPQELGRLQRQAIKNVDKSLDRFRQIVQYFGWLNKMKFHEYDLIKTPLHLDDLIQDVINDIGDAWLFTNGLSNVRIRFDRSGKNATVEGDQIDLSHVVQGLLYRFLKREPDGGEVVIRTSVKERAGEVSLHLSRHDPAPPWAENTPSPDPWPEESWRWDARGAGLATSKKIVKAHGGTFSIEPVEAWGLVCEITFPTTSRSPEVIKTT